MAWWQPALAVGGTLLSGLLGGRGRRSEVEKVDTLHPVQEALFQQMGEHMGGMFQSPGTMQRDAQQYYQQAVHAPAMESFQKEVLPQIQQAHTGPGTYWGSERARGMERAGTDMARGLAGQRAETMFGARQADRQHQMDQMSQILAMLQTPTGVAREIPAQPTAGQIISSQTPDVIRALLQYWGD